jgi:hypothetical protein
MVLRHTGCKRCLSLRDYLHAGIRYNRCKLCLEDQRSGRKCETAAAELRFDAQSLFLREGNLSDKQVGDTGLHFQYRQHWQGRF